jgi:hypothetical protein
MRTFLSRGLAVAVVLILVSAPASADPFDVISGDLYTFISQTGDALSGADTYTFLHTMTFEEGFDTGQSPGSMIPSSFPVNLTTEDGNTLLDGLPPIAPFTQFFNLGVFSAFDGEGGVEQHVLIGTVTLNGAKPGIIAGWDNFKDNLLNTQGSVGAAAMWTALGVDPNNLAASFLPDALKLTIPAGEFGVIGIDDIFTHSPPLGQEATVLQGFIVQYGGGGTDVGAISWQNFNEVGGPNGDGTADNAQTGGAPGGPPGDVPEPLSVLLCAVGVGIVLRRRLAA